MANKLHGDLTDADGIHEPKDISTASDREIYIANGADSGNWGPGAWDTSHTPTVLSQSGTITTSSASCRFLKIGSIVFFKIEISITTNGTGGGAVIVTLPFTPQGLVAVHGVEDTLTGYTVSGNNSGASLYVRNYDASYPGADGMHIVLQGSYEV